MFCTLAILATSVDAKCIFSKGHLCLSRVQNRLSAQMTCALLCIGEWSRLNLICSKDIKTTSALLDIKGDAIDYQMEEGWEQVCTALDAHSS